MNTDRLTCTLSESHEEDLEEYVVRQLESFNDRQSPWILQKRMPGRGALPLEAYLRNAEGDIFGGALGFTLWDWLEVENLWVWEGVRGRNWGRRLLETLEAGAQARGCLHVQLHTWDFQAPGFYKTCGYRVVGEMADYPPGGSLFWLRKDLS